MIFALWRQQKIFPVVNGPPVIAALVISAILVPFILRSIIDLFFSKVSSLLLFQQKKKSYATLFYGFKFTIGLYVVFYVWIFRLLFQKEILRLKIHLVSIIQYPYFINHFFIFSSEFLYFQRCDIASNFLFHMRPWNFSKTLHYLKIDIHVDGAAPLPSMWPPLTGTVGGDWI